MPLWTDYGTISAPADGDTFLEHDISETIVGVKMKRITWLNIMATIKTYTDTLYAPITGGGGDKYPMEARLTLETGVAISTTGQTAKTTLYLTPYQGCQVATYDGVSAWSVIELTADLSLNISGYTASKPYDIWVYNNAGTLTLDSTIWTNDTTRATALALQNGVYVKSGATTRRYVGTIRITGTTGECEDSTARRFVWNYYNRVHRNMLCTDPTDSWTYTTTTWRAANNTTTSGVGQFECVIGVAGGVLDATNQSFATNTTAGGVAVAVGIGIDSTSVNSADIFSGAAFTVGLPIFAIIKNQLAVGYHYIQRLEISQATGTTTWYGDNGLAYWKTGMVGTVMG
jgi:hypothetical protein